jgi:uncharacterized protein YciI
MFGEDGETRTGLWLMIDAPDRAAAEMLIAGEGFNRAGMFCESEIKRFIDTSPEERRQVDIAADRALQMFICECFDSAEAAEIGKAEGEPGEHREAIAGRVIVRGFSVSDDGSEPFGALAIVEVEDRAAADAFVAVDPMFRAGTHRPKRVDRWRFGKSVARR